MVKTSKTMLEEAYSLKKKSYHLEKNEKIGKIPGKSWEYHDSFNGNKGITLLLQPVSEQLIMHINPLEIQQRKKLNLRSLVTAWSTWKLDLSQAAKEWAVLHTIREGGRGGGRSAPFLRPDCACNGNYSNSTLFWPLPMLPQEKSWLQGNRELWHQNCGISTPGIFTCPPSSALSSCLFYLRASLV